MYKPELISKIAKKTNTSEALSEKFLKVFLHEVSSALKKGQKVHLVGFGTFLVRKKKKMLGRNPATGGRMVIPAHKAPAFVAGRTLKRSLK